MIGTLGSGRRLLPVALGTRRLVTGGVNWDFFSVGIVLMGNLMGWYDREGDLVFRAGAALERGLLGFVNVLLGLENVLLGVLNVLAGTRDLEDAGRAGTFALRVLLTVERVDFSPAVGKENPCARAMFKGQTRAIARAVVTVTLRGVFMIFSLRVGDERKGDS